MAEDKKEGSAFSLPSAGVIAIVLSLIGSLFITPGAFIDERPPNQGGVDNDFGYAQDIDARLWQDPFDAIKKNLEKSPSQTVTLMLSKKDDSGYEIKLKDKIGAEKNDNKHEIDRVYHHWRQDSSISKITVIAAMVSGGPYAETQEMRIRRRYALVSALSTQHFKPNDSEHIGYFKPVDNKNFELPEAVPFEWFDLRNDLTNVELNKFSHKVLVLWLDDTRFRDQPAKKIREIFRQVSPNEIHVGNDNQYKLDYAVIGPNDSGQLSALVKDGNITTYNEKEDNTESYHTPRLNEIRFYPAVATAEDTWLLEGKGRLSEVPGINIARTIASDRRVAEKLVEELKLRQIDPGKDHVALLSEWDTFYGRALPLTFAASYNGKNTYEWFKSNPVECKSFSNVHCFSYERGIDGKLPGGQKKEDAKDDSKPAQGEKKSSDIYDRPDGLSQKDYLRRLVDQIRELDHHLIEKDNGCFDASRRCGISAIGVLGYDVYDKLAILQALRPYFPGKIFFTTELDALYSAPKELVSTHNLIVVSGFGLKLRPELQINIPPFRDSYQTSFFLATLLALRGRDEDVQAWTNDPRVSEIGRKGPVDISTKIYLHDCNGNFFPCSDIHPMGVFNRPHYHESMLRIFFVIMLIILLYRASWKFKEKVEQAMDAIQLPGCNKKIIFFIVLFTIVVFIVILFVIINKSEEPLIWSEGVSIWPAEMLRILAFILSVVFVFKIRNELRGSNVNLENKYIKHGVIHDTIPSIITGVNTKIKKKCSLSFKEMKSTYFWQCPDKNSEKINIKKLWIEYIEKSTFHARIVRSLPNLLVFIIFAYSAILLSGGLPAPVRGNVAFYADRLITAISGMSALLLIMVVVDASRLGHRLIQHLDSDGKPSDWPCAENFAKNWGISKDYVVYWIDVRFAADFTETNGKFIWYPIITLLLMVAARSSFFDDSVFSYGLAISISILLIYLFSCAFWLQNGACKMREKAINELNKKLNIKRGVHIKNKEENIIIDKEIAQLERMINEIENIKKGAFTPFMQQPPVRAVLAIIGGGSGLPLLERFF